jgi:ubiquinone biosynthesis protein
MVSSGVDSFGGTMAVDHAPVGRARRAARYREIVGILWEERVLNLLKDSGLAEHAPAELTDERIAELEATDVGKLPHEVRVRLAIERLGPAFVKVAQLLSTRRDLISPALADELAKLQDDVPTLPFEEIRPLMEEELGGPIEERFASFDTEPMAAASIAQVYRATLKDGSAVVVKVQRPNVAETMAVDLDIMLTQAHWAARHTDWGSQLDVVEVVEELVNALRSELDYQNEARSLDYFRNAFADGAEVCFPAVHWELTTPRIITMDVLEGIRGTQLDDLDSGAVDRLQVARNGTACYFKQIFELGRYHADPHLGNVFVMPDGKVGFVDVGRVGCISPRNRNLTFQLLMALMNGDEVVLTETLIAMTGAESAVDIAGLQRDVAHICSAYSAAESTGSSLQPAEQEMFDVLRRRRLALPGQIVMLLTVLGVLEGVAAKLSAGAFQVTEAIRPFAEKMLPQEFGPEHVKEYMSRWLLRSASLVEELPVSAARALRRAGEGEFQVAVRPDDFDRFMDRAGAIVNRLCAALILSAFIVGASSLSGNEGRLRAAWRRLRS